MQMNWESIDSLVFMNPTYSPEEQTRFQRILEMTPDLPRHIWLSTSGSSAPKWVGLSKQAILASAEAVNQHLESTYTDVWIQPLPDFHVGGLGIWARAHLSKATVCDFKQEHPGKWQAEVFYHYIIHQKGTLTALVPTQLHDLVMLERPAPESLRAVIIGGGALLPDLYMKAVALGWPVLPSYGLTECASQVATAALDSWKKAQIPALQILSHLYVEERDERLCFRGTSLLSAYAYLEGDRIQVIDPKENGWLRSEDRGCVKDRQLQVWGRADAMVKVGGENVDLARLEVLLQTVRLGLAIQSEVVLLAVPDARLGHRIDLVATQTHSHQSELDLLMHEFHQAVLPFERIRQVHFLKELPRSALGKILKSELIKLVN